MTPQQLLGIAVRLYSIWLGLSCVQYFAALPAALRGMPDTGNAQIFVYGVGAVYAVAALALWFFPMLAAHWLLPRTRHDNRLSVQGHVLSRAGSALLGLWLFARTVPELLRFGIYALIGGQTGSMFNALDLDRKGDFGVSIFELVVALALIIKSRTFANLVFPQAAGEIADRESGDDNEAPAQSV